MLGRFSILLASMIVIVGVLGIPVLSYAQTPEPACGAGKGLIDPNCTLQQNLEKIYPVAVRIIALLAFLGVIYAGYLYITSFGQADRITEAKNWLIAAITGVILILLVPVIITTIESLPLPGR